MLLKSGLPIIVQAYGKQFWHVRTVSIATLSDNTLAVTVVSAVGVSVNILKKMLQIWRSVILC